MNIAVKHASALTALSLTEAAEAVAKGDTTAVELTQAALDAIKAGDERVNAFIWLEGEQALEAAAALDRVPMSQRGKLHGVPLAHKDMYYKAGKLSTCGSKIRAAFRPSYTATVIERLEAQGSFSLGGLNMAEFAQNATGHNQHYGHCHNPWGLDYCPGGSSSGSGAAVAARFVYAALGSDTGGSIRLPASLCGVTGIKGTQTRVSRHGVMPLSFSADNVGPLARSAKDCARIMTVIAGHDPKDATSSSEPVPDYEASLDGDLKGIKVGVPRNYFLDDADPEVVAAFEAMLDVLKRPGRHARSGDDPAYGRGRDLWWRGLARRRRNDPCRVDAATRAGLCRPSQFPALCQPGHLGRRLCRGAVAARANPEGDRFGGVYRGRRLRCADHPLQGADAALDRCRCRHAGSARRLQHALAEHAADQLYGPALGQRAVRIGFQRPTDRLPGAGTPLR